MNGIQGSPASASVWSEAKNPEGRVYYYNTQTRETRWDKPAEIMSPAEVCLLETSNSWFNFANFLTSARPRLGRSTLLKGVGSTGIIQNPR
jgi:WW domain